MSEEQLKYFLQGIGTFGWRADYKQFCEVCEFDSETDYAYGKWEQWRELQCQLNNFSTDLLLKFVNEGHKYKLK